MVINETEKKITHRYRFLKKPLGVIPTLLKNLLAARANTKNHIKKLKKELKETTDEKQRKYLTQYITILDKRQLAYKVTANSTYGQTGAKTSSFYEPDVAAATTKTGQELLIYAKNVIEGVYGDKF